MTGTWMMPFQTDQVQLTSGVGLVTTDGAWPEESADDKYKGHDIKILGFTDRNYVPLAKAWYTRMSLLGYTEHYIVAHDEASYNILRANDMRVLPCFIKNPDISHKVKGLWQQIMSARLHFTQELLRNGTHVLITDVDNIFSRHVPLYGFLEEGYDVYHAFEMRYPVNIYNEFGFVICSGHQFLRSSPETLRFMDLVMARCRGAKCDDQVIYNLVFFYDLNIKWDNIDNPNHEGALRIKSPHPENGNLLVESVTGRSVTTNHTIKIWDRDFAWRLAGAASSSEGSAIPDYCPSSNNWLGMPTKLDVSLAGFGNKIYTKVAAFEVWDNQCRKTELLGLTLSHVISSERLP
eukprot:CAMPEP_0172328226 /NCGR_PEP_ID=MMETSP1058-20130122/60242_1 /TAXON_ID=83371 /ORGANISM="Detonula confervacea, Strain CCMP 353" /LENGTH=348 /DNA_ID=CAMNT_0013045329 /DNA_START=327 /DNA_END=1373 /DNA_ORIENTATION=+